MTGCRVCRVLDLPDDVTLDFLIGDFESAWSALEKTSSDANRGNFMFALMAMVLLEVACRFCEDDPRNLQRLKDELKGREPRYFTELPGRCPDTTGFTLPATSRARERRELLHFMFDVIRNGLAHKFGQKALHLSDGRLQFALTGATPGVQLVQNVGAPARAEHLSTHREGPDLWIKVRTDVLFVDVREAVRAAQLNRRRMNHLKPTRIDATVQSFADALEQAGHSSASLLPRGPGMPTWAAPSTAVPTGMAFSPTMIAMPPKTILQTRLAEPPSSEDDAANSSDPGRR